MPYNRKKQKHYLPALLVKHYTIEDTLHSHLNKIKRNLDLVKIFKQEASWSNWQAHAEAVLVKYGCKTRSVSDWLVWFSLVLTLWHINHWRLFKAKLFSSYVRIRDVVLRTYLGRWTIGRSGERGSGISVLPARYDDDDDIYIKYMICKLILLITFLNETQRIF